MAQNPQFDKADDYKARILPLLAQLQEITREMNIPCLVFFCTKSDGAIASITGFAGGLAMPDGGYWFPDNMEEARREIMGNPGVVNIRAMDISTGEVRPLDGFFPDEEAEALRSGLPSHMPSPGVFHRQVQELPKNT